ncbi:hypothetical protein DLAC_05647 [Tieghemostelium lacteum]|uniref:YbaK/aminoacyl-tRNA synthetase-associated domain-containing protein n=1 Tax=Tieghemostelium lacteum TaxID=361077 RepID=A0A151ZGD6_TIELA|nr:hypothetical protein DLAC_05647 [Tieghemostelium lacteum]|eukprot:KYQ93038.1 hypothetical protein DLAC_05647 [Tieghemostelium lacteum]
MSKEQILCEKQNSILERLDKLKHRLDQITASDKVTANQQKIADLCKSISLESQLVRVPPPYYDWKLEQRASYLRAPSKDHLCKSLIMENTECQHTSTKDPLNSRYYCIIIQYTSKIQANKINRFLKNLNKNNDLKFNLSLAPPEISQQLTGFEYNAVAPLGTNVPIPIIISKKIMELAHNGKVWLGGGEIDLKLVVDIQHFKEKMEQTGLKVFTSDVIFDNDSNDDEDF